MQFYPVKLPVGGELSRKLSCHLKNRKGGGGRREREREKKERKYRCRSHFLATVARRGSWTSVGGRGAWGQEAVMGTTLLRGRQAWAPARPASRRGAAAPSYSPRDREGRPRRGGKGAAASPQPRLSSCSLWATRSSSASMAARLSSSWSSVLLLALPSSSFFSSGMGASGKPPSLLSSFE